MKFRPIFISLFFAFLFPFFILGEEKSIVHLIENSFSIAPDSTFSSEINLSQTQTQTVEVVKDSLIHIAEKAALSATKNDSFPNTPKTNLPFEPIVLDSMHFARNPLFSELVYMGKDIQLDWKKNDVEELLHNGKRKTLNSPMDAVEIPHPAEALIELRQNARDYITQTAPQLYRTTYDRLPKIDWEQQYQTIEIAPREHLLLDDNNFVPFTATNRIVVRRRKASAWQGKANVLLQISQTAISENWYKGGNDFFSLLGVVSGNINYDNKKKVKWENNFEWRNGFNTVEGDTLGRKAMPSDDVLKINSKYGLKATGNFYYSTSMEFQTQLFKNPKGVNDKEMKARFLTPIRLNIGIGMDYKYKKLSVALSPLSFKYIYLTDTTTTTDGFYLNPKTFGIEAGENHMKEFGSKLIVQLADYRPIPDLKINSKFNFYTNYEKFEIDWEIVAELSFNRFFSTRLMLNPRFDNTVILENDEKAKIQMKEMLTVGFSYRLY